MPKPNYELAKSLEQRSFLFFKQPLDENYKRLIMFAIYNHIKQGNGSNLGHMERQLRHFDFSRENVLDAIQALAHTNGIQAITVLRLQRGKSPTFQVRKTKHVDAWVSYLENVYPQVISVVGEHQ